MLCGVVWCGVVWCGVVWCGVSSCKAAVSLRTASASHQGSPPPPPLLSPPPVLFIEVGPHPDLICASRTFLSIH